MVDDSATPLEADLSPELQEAVHQLIEGQPELGYLDEADFIRDSLRHFLQEFSENRI